MPVRKRKVAVILQREEPDMASDDTLSGVDDMMFNPAVDLDNIIDMYMIMSVQKGLYMGDVKLEPPVLPHMGLGISVNQPKELLEKVRQDILGILCRYSIVHDKTMVMLGKSYAYMRDPTDEEIKHDIDHFGIEQILWPFDFYVERAEKDISELPGDLKTFKVFGEDHIYVGPPRMEEGLFACYIDTYKPRHPLELMIDTVEGRKPESIKYQIGESGFVVAIIHHDSPAVMEDIRDTKYIDIKKGYDHLMETIADESDEHKEKILRQREELSEQERYW